MPLVPRSRPALRAAAVLALTVAAPVARADVPAPPRNEACSVELLERSGDECLVPRFAPYPELWKERGFEPRCDLYGERDLRSRRPAADLWCRAPLAASKAGARSDASAGALPAGAPPGGAAPPAAAQAAALATGTGALASALLEVTRRELPGQNLALSPLALWTALATVTAGARGTTEAELRRGLALVGSPADAAGTARAVADGLRGRGVSFGLSSAVLLDEALSASPDLAAAARASGARIEPADFRRFPADTVGWLDRWVARETGGRLTRLVPPRSLYRNTRVAVATASGLVARWPDGFAPGAPMPFHLGRSPAASERFLRHARRIPVALERVETWRGTGTFAAASIGEVFGISGVERGAVVVDVPLAGAAAITLVLPHESYAGPIPRLYPSLPELLARLRPRRIALTVPAFAIATAPLSLGDALAGLEAGTPSSAAFDAKGGDLSGLVTAAARGERLVLGELFHGAYLELGGGAAARDATPGGDAAAGPGVPEVRLDRPFLFFVRDTASGAVLLAGAVNDPAPGRQAELADVVPGSLGLVARALEGARVVAGEPFVGKGVRREAVREVVHEHARDVASCYGQQLVLDPGLRGTVRMRWVLDGEGVARAVRGTGPGEGASAGDLRACLARTIERWAFPARGPVTVEQGWSLEPSSGAPAGAADRVTRLGRRLVGQPGEHCRSSAAAGGLGARPAPASLRARSADLEVSGPVDVRRVRKVLAAHAAEMRAAYEQRLAQDRRLQGTVALEWLVDAEGSVKEPRVDCSATTLDDPHLFEAMKGRLRAWKFPGVPPGPPAIVNHRWTFVPVSLGNR